MNLFEKSGQSVGDNSSAIQVTGDAHFGNTTTEVIAICQLIIKSEMSSLRQDAYALVEERAQEFGNQVAAKLSKDVDEQLRAKLADPDIQYTLNQAVVQVARKGFDAKSELLKELIVSKFKATEEEENLLLDHALDTTQRLATSEIKLLALIYYFRYCHKTVGGVNILTVVQSNADHPSDPQLTLNFCRDVFLRVYQSFDIDYKRIVSTLESINPVNRQMLGIKGCIGLDNQYEKGYIKLFEERTGLEIPSEDFFRENFASLSSMLDRFSINKITDLDHYVLTPIGNIIAKNYLEAHGFFEK